MTSPQAWLGPNVPVCCRGCHHRCRGLTGTPLSCCPGVCAVPTAVQGRTASLFGVQGRPSSAGKQSQVRRDARVCLLCARGGKHKQNKGSCPTLFTVGRRSTPCPQVALPQPGKVSSEPARLSRSQQQPQCLSPKAPARQSPELPTPVRAMSRRDPRFRTERPAFGLPQPSPHFALPTAGTAALLILFSL